MANKTRVVLGRGKGSMPIDTKPLPEPKTKGAPSGRLSQGSIESGMTNDTGDPVRDRMPLMKAPPMGNFNDSAPAAPGMSYFGGGRNEVETDYGAPVERMPPMMGGTVRPVFLDARINPDGSSQGRNPNNEFDEWTGVPGQRGEYGGINPGGGQLDSILSDMRGSIQGVESPRLPPSKPPVRSGSKPPQKPARKPKKKRWMPRKPKAVDKNGGA